MRRRLIVGALLGVVSCSEPAAPPRTIWYPFDFGGDVFRWTESRLPVRYYADTRSNMRDLCSAPSARGRASSYMGSSQVSW